MLEKTESPEGGLTGLVLLAACMSRSEKSELYAPKHPMCTPSPPEKKRSNHHQSILPLLVPPFGGSTKVPATGLQPSSGPLSSPLIKLAIEAV